LAYVLALVLAAAPLFAADIQPGMSADRDFGPVTLVISVDRNLAQAGINVRIGGQDLAQRVLTPSANTMALDLVNGAAAIRGSLAATFTYPKHRAVIIGDFKVTSGGRDTPFRGEIVGWLSPDSLILKRQRTPLTPELLAQTDVLLDESQSVEVRLITGTQVMHSFTVSQGANDAILLEGITVGTVTIQPGLSLHLQPAEPTQSGEIFLKGAFASSNLPVVKYAGAIANWSYVAPPP
jgi:hypothetical protein